MPPVEPKLRMLHDEFAHLISIIAKHEGIVIEEIKVVWTEPELLSTIVLSGKTPTVKSLQFKTRRRITG